MQIFSSTVTTAGATGRTLALVTHATDIGDVLCIVLEESGSGPRAAVPTIRWDGGWRKAVQWSSENWRQLESATLDAFADHDGGAR